MLAYRLCRVGSSALDGEGARQYGGRWNSPGRAVVYASATLSLAALEYLVHVDPDDAPTDLVALTIDIPDDLAVQAVDVSALPGNWTKQSGSDWCRQAGDSWIDGRTTAVIQVPAAPVPSEWNILINPGHPSAHRIKVVARQPFSYDPRLMA